MKGFIEVINTNNMRVSIGVATIAAIETISSPTGDPLLEIHLTTKKIVNTYAYYDDVKKLIEKAIV